MTKDNYEIKVLDPCFGFGSGIWWFDRENKVVTSGDYRSEIVEVKDTTNGKVDGKRVIRIEPDQFMDFRDLPFEDNTFDLVAFDPPHLIRAGEKSWMKAKYGRLTDNWRQDLRAGFSECFRVLRPHGTLVFKWSEIQIKLSEVLKCTDKKPLIGCKASKSTHFIVFMKSW